MAKKLKKDMLKGEVVKPPAKGQVTTAKKPSKVNEAMASAENVRRKLAELTKEVDQLIADLKRQLKA
jgi:predicted transcriptional regulator